MRNFLLITLIFSTCILSPCKATADEATHRDAVKTLFEVLDMKEAHKQGMVQMLAIQIQQNPQLGRLQDVQRKFFEKYMSWESLRDKFTVVFMDEFSEKEIRKLIDFYQTPTGRKTVTKMPVLLSKGNMIQSRRLSENMPELQQMIRDEIARRKAVSGN